MPASCIIQPVGRKRRLGMPRSLGVEASGSGDLDTIARWLDRSWVMSRDGTLTPSGGTGGAILSPRRGVSVTGPDSFDLAVPGYGSLKMVMAYDAITNLTGAMTASGQLLSNTLSGMKRTIVENTTTNLHYASGGAITLTDGASYRLCGILKREAGDKHAVYYWGRSGQIAGMAINFTTGAVASYVAGGGAVSSLSAVDLGNGRWSISCVITDPAWGGTVTPLLFTSTNGTAPTSHTGDGVSAISLEGATLTPLTDYAPLMAEGITRIADSWVWTTPAAVPQNCEITHLGWQPHVDGDNGVTSHMWIEGGTAFTAPRLFRGSATSLTASDYDGGSKTAAITRTLPNRAILFIQRHRRDAGTIAAGYGATLGTTTATGTLEAPTTIRAGFSSVAGRASRAGNAVIITPGGCTQAERDATARMFHLQPLAAVA
jgi:hypothetical protein